jgi:CO dehydrogenase maturation factor
MSTLIAVTGKGGVGKTTFSSLLVGRLAANGGSPVLAVDADPNSCLDAALGVKAANTVGRVREDVRNEVNAGLGAGISKQDLLRIRIAESLVEADGFDLIAMGRPEGAGCYCYANNVLKAVIAEISQGYPYVVLDNEAGLENLSRRIVQKVDLLALVSDPSNAGLETLRRLHALAGEMKIEYKRLVLVVNRVRGSRPAKAEEIRAATGADEVLYLPDDEAAAGLAERGEPLAGLPMDNALMKLVDGFAKAIVASKVGEHG